MPCDLCGTSDHSIRVHKEYNANFRGRNFRKIVIGFRCMQCECAWIDPEQDLVLERDYQAFVAKVLEETKNCTCVQCKDNEICQFRWDDYNTNGDCLMAK